MSNLKEDNISILKNVKHDLINPINTMIGYSELINDILIDSKNKLIISDLDSIYQSSKEILIIIQDLFIDSSEYTLEDIIKIISNKEMHYSIRTPLSSIIGLSELILENNLFNIRELDQEIKDSLLKINQSGKKLLRILDNLISYSNISASKLVESYYSDQYLKNSNIRDFNVDFKNHAPVESGNILIVDDEKSNLELIEKILIAMDHNVYTSNDSNMAIDILNKHSSKIDLILLDVIMPGVNGLDLLTKIKNNKKTSKIPVIMLSAIDEIKTIIESISLGADDFLIKPVNKILLGARINSSLEKKYYNDREVEYKNKIKIEQKKANDLLLNILPESIAKRLKDGETLIADDFESATVLFSDLKGFTELSSKIGTKDLLLLLNNIFSKFDVLLNKYSLEKIKTIGDNYMIAGGIPIKNKNHADSVARMALDMLSIIPKINMETGYNLKIRIGINTGPVSAGVIGKSKFIYDIWGDTVNIASRMETFGAINKVHVSESTFGYLKDSFNFTKCEKMKIPGKGMMQTYYLNGMI